MVLLGLLLLLCVNVCYCNVIVIKGITIQQEGTKERHLGDGVPWTECDSKSLPGSQSSLPPSLTCPASGTKRVPEELLRSPNVEDEQANDVT